jgi:enoyl-CoA hydratase/carnithine racemase
MVSRLADQIPRRLYEWMLTTGRPVDAQAADADCLVSEVVESGQARVRALEIARRVAETIRDPSAEKAAMLSGSPDD